MTQLNPYPFVRYSDANRVLNDEAMAHIAQYWTETTNDLDGISKELAAHIAKERISIAQFDYPRTDFWHDPDGIDVFADISYADDAGYGEGQVRGHLLDLYVPHDVVLRGGNSCPVFIDIHGGGFTYGYKELNRNFCTHLAAQGFAVFSLNYRPVPQTGLMGQLADIQMALRWIHTHLDQWPLSKHNIFITGDSAGAALAWLTMLIEGNSQAAQAFGIERSSGLPIRGAALISGVFSLGRDITSGPRKRFRNTLTHDLGQFFLDGLTDMQPDWLDPRVAIREFTVPPTYLVTSSDDFIESETLYLATLLAEHNVDFELHDIKVPPTQTLGHVFPVCLSWLDLSAQVFEQISKFTQSRCTF
ncbi:alpha/beta hydrolase fold protein [Bifidobacterium dolichotidis]|uniref:Alpha/beta hydrolase fold protein n=1 Tax=Bifidobacterium dolichotidis TaxID=2306976 RepID=A0A430FSH8_9BIFI|nr:alpha/beta hydrolase [Bifidobacterium dolichotidis]RSX55828.1 alpha/beta hydrolase fold protein [Bifidobacterium dolichotidis]